jgi:hypothetical protein
VANCGRTAIGGDSRTSGAQLQWRNDQSHLVRPLSGEGLYVEGRLELSRSSAHGVTTMMETDQRFYVRRSTIPEAGEGLFAAVSLVQGDRLRVVGVLIAADSVSDRCTRYADPYKVRVGEHLLIPTGWGAMVNHREDANVEKVVEGEDVYLEALRPIAKDEEIFFRYHEYAKNRFGPLLP